MPEGLHRRIAGFDPIALLRTYGPATLAFIPALALSALWFGIQGLLLVGALTLPGILIAAGAMPIRPQSAPRTRGAARADDATSLRSALHQGLTSRDGARSAALVLEVDDLDALRGQYGDSALDALLQACGARLDASLREGDVLIRQDETRFAIALAPGRRLDLEAMVQLSGRLQRALADPIPVGAHFVHLTASIGFCLPRRPEEKTADGCLAAAAVALDTAKSHGPGAIRAFVPRQAQASPAAGTLAADLPAALDAGQIVAWFQPQISTDTGAVTGMEALARWTHPTRGLIPPGEFLPSVAALGLAQRLTDAMLASAFDALKKWDDAGHDIGSVGVNFSGEDLTDPMLADRLRWEMDRRSLAPGRLAVEVLETVIANGADDSICRTLQQLAAFGCRIDLDDFGTGHAAIGSIRRFSVGRIKIDRSFVSRVDIDPDQQTMVTAILELAQRLGLDTLAEGVETVGEHSRLAQLGCGHVQGFSIARPMPFAETLHWLDLHKARVEAATWPDRRAG